MKTPDINKILNADRRNCSRGAPMGDTNIYDGSIHLHLQRVRFVDGDYGPDGTYWGYSPSAGDLYCAFNGDNANSKAGHGTRIYVRAHTREKAKELVKQHYVNVRFYR